MWAGVAFEAKAPRSKQRRAWLERQSRAAHGVMQWHARSKAHGGHGRTLARHSSSMTLVQASKDVAFPVADEQIKSVRFVS